MFTTKFLAGGSALIAVALLAGPATAACQRSVDGNALRIKQGNGFSVKCTLSQEGFAFDGICVTNKNVAGDASGTLKKGRLKMKVDWGSALGEYTAFVDDNGEVQDGRTFDVRAPGNWATWTARQPLPCVEE